jgi:glutaryl-CoA dehydrogenase (non-decarboxylating)
MKLELTPPQIKAQTDFRAFTTEVLTPIADEYDQEQKTPPEVIRRVAQANYLGALLPIEYGGANMDAITFGLLNEEIGRACSSVRSLLTVHSMVSFAILRWGTQGQKKYWLPRLASGQSIGAFALTEPNVGSDASQIETQAEPEGNGYSLNGRKKWITYGQIADLFLVFAQCHKNPVAFLVESDNPGLTIQPIHGMLGTRASMLAELRLEACRVPKENMIGGLGFGIAAVALSALDLGRYSVAWGCVGIGQACLEACLQYTSERKQFGKLLKEYQLIGEMITNMVTNVKAARLLCYQAGYLREIGDTKATAETLVAKYFASTMATKVANDAVQIHGASGCSNEQSVQRYFRDAKVMELIEGSSQMQQILISANAYTT